MQGFLGELIWSCLLVGAALSVGKTSDSHLQAALPIIAAVLSGAIAVGPISGGGFNPAVAVGLSLTDMLNGSDPFKEWWLYLLGPMFGGVLAAVFVSCTQYVIVEGKRVSASEVELKMKKLDITADNLGREGVKTRIKGNRL